jgi:hypothetical protein
MRGASVRIARYREDEARADLDSAAAAFAAIGRGSERQLAAVEAVRKKIDVRQERRAKAHPLVVTRGKSSRSTHPQATLVAAAEAPRRHSGEHRHTRHSG